MSRSLLQRLLALSWCVVLFAGTLWLHTRHNDFAWYYHPDEPGKVEQVLGMRAWNFHHPMLLLSTTKLAANATGAETPQAVVETGRTVSAIFTAGAVVALSLLALLARGWRMGIGAGLALMLHHQLFELSHYMKEDTAFLLGVALAFLAGFAHQRRPSATTAAFLGVACGLAISGKYLGAVALVVPAVAMTRSRIRGAWLAFTVGLVAVILVVNFPMFSDPATFTKSFARETKLVVEGQGAVTQSVPHSRYWSVFLANTTPVMWVLLLVTLTAAVKRRRLLSPMEWTLLFFPFAYALALSFSPKDNDRYFLPASAIFTLLALAGASYLGDVLRRKYQPAWTEAAAICAVVLAQFPSWTDDRGGLLRYYEAFQKDDTADLVTWIRENIPPAAAIAKDDRVRLPSLLRHGAGPGATLLPHRVLTDTYVADLGSFEELRAQGVTHIVTTPGTYQRFERAGLRPKPGEEARFNKRRQFYAALRRDFDYPAWERRRGTVIYLHPGLEVYRIAD